MVDGDEARVADEDVEVVGRGAGREPHGDLFEGQGDARTGTEPGLEEPLLVRDRGGERGPDIGQPPPATLVGHLQEVPVEEGVVVDLDIALPTDRQGPVHGRLVQLAAEVDRHHAVAHQFLTVSH